MVGANDLALRVCEELCATHEYEVKVMWDEPGVASAAAERLGATFVRLAPNDHEALAAAGIREAVCIMPVTEDDRLNLQVALKARDLNAQIRIVLRQFNRALGQKIEQNLPNCAAISPAAHAAATYAGAALDRACFYALQFASIDGPLVGFSERAARDFQLGECSVAEAERRLGARIAAVSDRVAPSDQDVIRPGDRIVACAPVHVLQNAWHRRSVRRPRGLRAIHRASLRDIARSAVRFEPLLFYTFAGGTLLFFAAAICFMFVMHLNFVEAMYFTASTMLTVGYGDITPYQHHTGILGLLLAIAVMIGGVIAGGLFIATMSSGLSRAQETALRGLRHIHAEDHVVLCGAGNVGTRIIDFLLRLDQRIVVIERNPSALLLEQARTRQIELLAGDATSDDTLGFCDLRSAQSFVAVTDSDTANLEAVLGALVQNPDIPVVLRILDPVFSRSVTRNFRIAKSFSASDLTAPVIAGLARGSGAHGRVSFAARSFSLAEGSGPDELLRTEGAIPLFVLRAGNLVAVRDSGEVKPGDRLLYMVPLAQARAE